MTTSIDMPETWLPVSGHEGVYEVSDLGRVRSLDRCVRATPTRLHPDGQKYSLRGQTLKASPDKNGYLHLRLSKSGRSRLTSVHGLVCEAFHGRRPEGQEVRHLNGNPVDNRATNLAWGTPLDNQDDVKRHGRQWQLNKTHCPQGHEYSADNTRVGKRRDGTYRVCRTCANARNARRYRRRKAGRHLQTA